MEKTRSACRRLSKVRWSSRKITPSAIGTTTASVAADRCWFSNWPPQLQEYPRSSGAVRSTAARASATNPTRSRPETLATTVAKRCASSRTTCTGPSSSSTRATWDSATMPPPGRAMGTRASSSDDRRAASSPRSTRGTRMPDGSSTIPRR